MTGYFVKDKRALKARSVKHSRKLPFYDCQHHPWHRVGQLCKKKKKGWKVSPPLLKINYKL